MSYQMKKVDYNDFTNLTVKNLMPDYSRTQSKSLDIDHTADKNGWLMASINGWSSKYGSLTIDNVIVFEGIVWSGNCYYTGFVPVAKGQVYKLTGGHRDGHTYLNFIPCIGE